MYGLVFSFFFFNDTATTEIYTLSLHDALPISPALLLGSSVKIEQRDVALWPTGNTLRFRQPDSTPKGRDRKSTRLNSSHLVISYAVFCLKKKKNRKSTQNYSPLSTHWSH